MTIEWIPGKGICETSLARMRERSIKPTTSMGEAWFMGESREMFDDLTGDLDRVPVQRLQQALMKAFGLLNISFRWKVLIDSKWHSTVGRPAQTWRP